MIIINIIVMNIKEYVDKFHILGKDNILNCDNICCMLYSAYITRFNISFSNDEYILFKEYQERIYDFVEDIRELDIDIISNILTYINSINIYIADIIIMSWCLPRTDNYLSKKIYNMRYKENIKKYNNKIIDIIDHNVIKNFCYEVLKKNKSIPMALYNTQHSVGYYIPIHCIDYIWYYIDSLSFELTFYNMESANYINIDISDDNYIKLGFNMEYLLELGLGKVDYLNDPIKKGPFNKFLLKFIIDKQIVDVIMSSDTKNNYIKQLSNIYKNPKKYFDFEIENSLINIIKNKNI